MTAQIFAKFGDLKGKAFLLKEETLVGRAQTNQIVLAHKLVSNRHARIYRDKEKGCFVIEDLGSLNGTLLDGVAIKRPRKLGHLHMVNFGGSTEFFFLDPSQVPTGQAVGTRSVVLQDAAPKAQNFEMSDKRKTYIGKEFAQTPAVFTSLKDDPQPTPDSKEKRNTMFGQSHAIIPSSLLDKIQKQGDLDTAEFSKQVPEGFYLVMSGLDELPVRYLLREGENMVGRGEDLAVRIIDSQMSRHHALITIRDGKAFLRDLGSTNHCFVNGKRIRKETELKPGCELAFGKLAGTVEIRNMES